MALAAKLQAVAKMSTDKWGSDITVKSVSVGTYNPTTGVAAQTKTSYLIKGIVGNITAKDVRDETLSLLKDADKKVFIAATDLLAVPDVTYEVDIGDETYHVTGLKINEIEGEKIAYVLGLKQ